MFDTVGLFVMILAYVLLIAILVRVILSWTGIDANNPLTVALTEITEPILAPIRQFMPRIGMLDLSPMAASFLLFLVANAASQLRG